MEELTTLERDIIEAISSYYSTDLESLVEIYLEYKSFDRLMRIVKRKLK